jgi:ribosome-associated protein
MTDLHLPDGRIVPDWMITVRRSLSGGPGGQHVNKTETKVDLRLNLPACAAVFTEAEMNRLRRKLKNNLDAEGFVQVICQTHKSQRRNLEEAHEKMRDLLVEGLKVPKRRRPTRPTKGSQRRRLDEKRKQGQLKKERTWKPE